VGVAADGAGRYVRCLTHTRKRAYALRVALPERGTSAMPLFDSVSFSQLGTVDVTSSDKYPVLLTDTALNNFVPNAGALFHVTLPSDHEPLI